MNKVLNKISQGMYILTLLINIWYVDIVYPKPK